ncbi:MAG: DMT family transporter, partial [Spirochaetota bacterium]
LEKKLLHPENIILRKKSCCEAGSIARLTFQTKRNSRVVKIRRNTISGLKALPLLIILGFLLGSTMVVSRFAIKQFDALTYVALRFVLASMVNICIYIIVPGLKLPSDIRVWAKAALVGLVGTALTFTAYIKSLNYLSSGVVSVLVTLTPVVTFILAQVFLKDEPLSPRKMIGAVVAFIGAGVLFVFKETGLPDITQPDLRGYAWVFLGLVGNAWGLVIIKRSLKTETAFTVASIRSFSTTLVLIPLTLLSKGFNFSGVRASGFGSLLYAAIFGTCGSIFLYSYITKRFGASMASQTEYITPVFASALGAIFLAERITLIMGSGVLLIFVGIRIIGRMK